VSPRPDRSGAASRSVWLLLVVAVVAVGTLWFASRRQQTDYTLGGALFPVDAARIEGLLLTRQGRQYRFERQDDGTWSLSGAVSDYLDPQAMSALVQVLPTARGGAVLPGTEIEDRRYAFNGPEAIRLRIFLSDGPEIALALGALNPVTGNYYASGAGREGCFPVAGPFRDKLFMLPKTVQAKRLLPPFERDRVRELRLTRGTNDYQFTRHDDHWWLRLDTDDLSESLARMPAGVRDYQKLYDDRRRRDAAGTWIMASNQALGQLIYEVSEVIVREIKSPRESAASLQNWDLDPPWRQVVLQGPGLNPDPGAPTADQYVIAFGPPLGTDRVPALRRGNVLITDFEAVNLLDQPLEVLVEQFALNATALTADRLRVEREGTLLLSGSRTAASERTDGREAWRTTFPPSGRENLSETGRHGFSQDLVVNLNRVPILAVLPPTNDPAVLQDRERVRLTLSWGQGDQARSLVLETGFLAVDRLAGGTDLARAPAGGPAVGLWFPDGGKLLQIPDQLIVTARSMVPYTRPVHSQ
jgi:hypothetical protein